MASALTLSKKTDTPEETLMDDIHDPMVMNAARHLIMRHRAGQNFDIDAFDVPHVALADISQKLEDSGVSHSMADPLIASLRRYIMAYGGGFVRAVNAKPVVIRLTVAPQMPDRRFENGMTELACIGSAEIKVEGATSVNVRATPTGTATSSNAADVDAIFASVKGLHLWVRFEAPTRQDIDALMTSMEASLAGVAQSVGGAMNAEDFKKLLETLQAQGAMTPAALALINNLIALQEEMKGGTGTLSQDAIAALIQDISKLIGNAQADGLIPASLIQAAMMSMADLSSNSIVSAFLIDQGFSDLIAGNDNLPAVPDLSSGEALHQLLEDLAAKINAGEMTAEELPPALAALMEEMGGLETLLNHEGRAARIEALTLALSDEGTNAQLSQTLQAAILAMTDPQILASLPVAMAQALQNFVTTHPAIIGMAATQTMIRDMGTLLETLDPASAEALELQQAIDLLKSDGFQILLDKNVQAALSPQAIELIQKFSEQHPAAIEIAATQSFLRAMENALEGLDPSSPEAINIAKIITLVKNQGISDFLDNPATPPDAIEIVHDIMQGEPPTIPIETERAFSSIQSGLAAVASSIDPADNEIAALLLARAARDIQSQDSQKPLPNGKAREILQTLVDAKEKITGTDQKAKIDRAIEAIRNNVADPKNKPPIPAPTKIPVLRDCCDPNNLKYVTPPPLPSGTLGEKVRQALGGGTPEQIQRKWDIIAPAVGGGSPEEILRKWEGVSKALGGGTPEEVIKRWEQAHVDNNNQVDRVRTALSPSNTPRPIEDMDEMRKQALRALPGKNVLKEGETPAKGLTPTFTEHVHGAGCDYDAPLEQVHNNQDAAGISLDDLIDKDMADDFAFADFTP